MPLNSNQQQGNGEYIRSSNIRLFVGIHTISYFICSMASSTKPEVRCRQKRTGPQSKFFTSPVGAVAKYCNEHVCLSVSVCVSDCLSLTQVDPRYHVLDGVPDTPREGANFEEKRSGPL